MKVIIRVMTLSVMMIQYIHDTFPIHIFISKAIHLDSILIGHNMISYLKIRISRPYGCSVKYCVRSQHRIAQYTAC